MAPFIHHCMSEVLWYSDRTCGEWVNEISVWWNAYY